TITYSLLACFWVGFKASVIALNHNIDLHFSEWNDNFLRFYIRRSVGRSDLLCRISTAMM
ncbi:MAG TPA: hypothetical protein VJ654_18330, partial [Noviherbaspirillum sp.]|nr:hypothetical protein [Noviherbaspirillum sp.]